MADRLTPEDLAKAHDGMCGMFIGDGPCSCLVHWVETLQKELDGADLQHREAAKMAEVLLGYIHALKRHEGSAENCGQEPCPATIGFLGKPKEKRKLCGQWEPGLGPCVAEIPCAAHEIKPTEEPMTQTYFSPEQLKLINDSPKILSLLYDLDLLPEQVIAAIRHAREKEQERCAKLAESPACACSNEDVHDGCCASCGSRIAKMIRKPLEKPVTNV